MLTGKQRSYLRSQGNSLDPVVHIGKDGLSDSVLSQLNEALDDHELIKVRVLENSGSEMRATADKIADRCSAEIVQIIGSVFLIYRQNQEDPQYNLP